MESMMNHLGKLENQFNPLVKRVDPVDIIPANGTTASYGGLQVLNSDADANFYYVFHVRKTGSYRLYAAFSSTAASLPHVLEFNVLITRRANGSGSEVISNSVAWNTNTPSVSDECLIEEVKPTGVALPFSFSKGDIVGVRLQKDSNNGGATSYMRVHAVYLTLS